MNRYPLQKGRVAMLREYKPVHIRGRMRTEKIRELESKLTIEELQQMACMIDLLVEHHGWKMDELQAEIDRRVAEDNRRREEGTLVAVVRGIKQ